MTDLEKTDGSFSIVTQTELTTRGRVRADCSPSLFWERIATTETFQTSLVESVRKLLSPESQRMPAMELYDAGVTAAEGGYARVLSGLDLPSENDRHQQALDLVSQIGQDGATILGHRPLKDITDGPLAALAAAQVSPTITVYFDDGFRDQKRKQREDILWVCAVLGKVADLRIATTGLTARWLLSTHREDIPGSASFSDSFDAPVASDEVIEQRIETALDVLDLSGRPVRILRNLEREPSERLAYSDLKSEYEVTGGRISQILGDLEDLELITRFGSQGDRQVELSRSGSKLLTVIDEEIGRQQTLDELFNDTGQPSQRDVLPQPHERGGYRTHFLGRAEHHASAASSSTGDITTVSESLPESDDVDDPQTRHISYDESRDEVVVAVTATTPFQYITSIALALTSEMFFETVLPVSRLEKIDRTPEILRDARCIGALSAEATEDPELFRDQLLQWGTDLAEMTTQLSKEEYDDRARFCGEILRSAHGLAGTIVHLLDVLGIDVVRELRLPSLTDDQIMQIARTVAISVAIQSKYDEYASYRQLFETREFKRKTALTPTVDAENQLGEFIGSLVIRGYRAHRFGYHVEGQLSSLALSDEAPEFAVRLEIAPPGREAYTSVTNRMLSTKNMRATPESVTLFQALTNSPYDVSKAVERLGEEDQPRMVRLDEVRVALASLNHERLLAEAPPSVSKAVAVLMRSSRPLSRDRLAEKASISTRSLDRHLEPLVILDIVRETDRGYRIVLPSPETERGQTLVPAPVEDNISAQGFAFEIVLSLVESDEAGRLGEPDDQLGQPFFGPKFEARTLRRCLPEADPYLQIILIFCDHSQSQSKIISFGPDLEQTSLTSPTMTVRS